MDEFIPHAKDMRGSRPRDDLESLSQEELVEYVRAQLNEAMAPMCRTFITPSTLATLETIITERLLMIFPDLRPSQFKVTAWQDDHDYRNVKWKLVGPHWLYNALGVVPQIKEEPEPMTDLTDTAHLMWEASRKGQITRRILTLAPRETHGENGKNCPMHLVPLPNGSWMCLDCGQTLVMKSIELTAQTIAVLEAHAEPWELLWPKRGPGSITEGR